MQFRIRTATGWVIVGECAAMALLSTASYLIGSAIIEHNAFMNQHYPLSKGNTK